MYRPLIWIGLSVWFGVANCSAGTYGGGSGDQGDPYKLATAAHLRELAQSPADFEGYFIVTQDIDMQHEPFEGVGVFRGVFDGQGHTIRNVMIDGRQRMMYVGFFANCFDAEIKHVTLENVTVRNAEWATYVGGLVGFANPTLIQDCHVLAADVWGFDQVGALIGAYEGGDHILQNCSAAGLVCGNDYVGGLVGWANLPVQNCQAAVTIYADDYAGGLVGYAGYAVSSCQAEGCIQGDSCVGGLIGFAAYGDGLIEDCQSYATIEAHYNVGGLVGSSNKPLLDCRAVGSVTGGEGSIGGLAGSVFADVTRCWAEGDVEGDYYVGGLVGLASGSGATVSLCRTGNTVIAEGGSVGGLIGNCQVDIDRCYSHCVIWVTGDAGGLAGSCNGNIYDSYAQGRIVGIGPFGYASGLVAHFNDNSKVLERCYSSVQLPFDGYNEPRGLVRNDSLIITSTGCFWDDDVSPCSQDDADATPLDTAAMQTQATFTAAGWDFGPDGVWTIREGQDYPRLAWETPTPGDVVGWRGVDMQDFAFFVGHWSEAGCVGPATCGGCDFDESGTVDLPDMQTLAENWLIVR